MIAAGSTFSPKRLYANCRTSFAADVNLPADFPLRAQAFGQENSTMTKNGTKTRFRLEEATIDELHAAIRAGETTLVQVVEHYYRAGARL